MRVASSLSMPIAEHLLIRSRSRLRRTFMAMGDERLPWLDLRFASYEIQALQHLLKSVGPLYGLTAGFKEVSREAMEVFTAVETGFMCFSSLTRLDEQAAVVLGKWDRSTRPIRIVSVAEPLSEFAAYALTADSEESNGEGECDSPLSVSVPSLAVEAARGLARHSNELDVYVEGEPLLPDAAAALAQQVGYALTLELWHPPSPEVEVALTSNPKKRVRIKPWRGRTRVYIVDHDRWYSYYES